jgi:type 2 lantibiotic biosynthesis protein LanM
MQLARENLIEIVERSAFLHERLGPNFVANSTQGDSEAVQKRFQQWQQQVARGEDSYFQRRLSWDGLDQNTARAIATGVRLRNPDELPTWAELLETVIASTSGADVKSLEASPFISPERPVPFEHLFVSFVRVASDKLKESSGDSWSLLSETAMLDVQRDLLKTLSRVADKALEFEFSIWRALPDNSFTAAPAGRHLYHGFIKNLLDGGLITLFVDYPVLAKWLGRIMEQWISSFSHFLLALKNDLADLESGFAGGKPLGKIHSVWTGLSDRHSAGRTVLRVTFENGTNYFYKPRNCKSESDYNRVLEWINKQDPLHQLHTYKVIYRPTHGWIEEVRHLDCEDQGQLPRYYQRAGMLVALLYALQASDCNFENIISHGEHPALIDTETFFQPRPQVFDADEWKALETASQAIYYDSVFRLSLLPQWIARPDGDKMDVSGLGSGPGKRGSVRRKVWRNVNTDEMSLTWETVIVGNGIRGLQFRGEPVEASAFAEDILIGFDWMYSFLLNNRDRLWAADGPLPGMTGVCARIVVRNTVTYASLLESCLVPQHLRNGMDASIWVEILARRFSRSEERPPAWDMVGAEEAALLDLNIPKFEAPCESDVLQISPEKYIQQYFISPGFLLFKQRFYELSEADRELQKCYVRHAFGYFASASSFVDASKTVAAAADPVDVFIQQALAIAERIEEKSIRAPDGSSSWITQVYNMDSQFWQLQPIGINFYDGVCGIALFLAALEKVTGETRYRDLLTSVLKVLRHFSSPQMRSHMAYESVGAGLGTSSLAYSLARVGSLLKDEELIHSAFEIAQLVTKKEIAADRRLDVIGGTAGCLLVLRTLYKLRPQPWILQRAAACGDHLLETRSVTESGLRSWQTIKRKFLAGLSHGAAGMIYALSELYQLTGNKVYRDAAFEAQAYETSLFSEEKRNWPNLLLPKKEGGFDFWNSWCHGAPGIGLARLSSRECLDGAASERDLENALQTAAARELTEIDTPCCGNLGRLELLVQASQKLGKPEWLDTARKIGACVVERALTQGGYGTGVKSGIYIPSFHQGMAGVGYQLLRLAHPDKVESVLCWE